MKDVYKTFTEMKALTSLKPALRWQHKEFDYYYHIFFDEANVTYFTELWKDTSKVKGINVTQNDIDLTDWEDNYLALSNQPYPQYPEQFDVRVTAGNINAQVVGGALTAESLIPRYTPKFYGSKVAIALSDTVETELVNLDFNGRIDAINVNFDRDDVELIVYVDTEEIFRATLEDLVDPQLYDFQHEACVVSVRNNGKHFVALWRTEPPDVMSNLTIKAKKTVTATTQMKAISITYRKKVPFPKYSTIQSNAEIAEA